jgi:hypothetical protein
MKALENLTQQLILPDIEISAELTSPQTCSYTNMGNNYHATRSSTLSRSPSITNLSQWYAEACLCGSAVHQFPIAYLHQVSFDWWKNPFDHELDIDPDVNPTWYTATLADLPSIADEMTLTSRAPSDGYEVLGGWGPAPSGGPSWGALAESDPNLSNWAKDSEDVTANTIAPPTQQLQQEQPPNPTSTKKKKKKKKKKRNAEAKNTEAIEAVDSLTPSQGQPVVTEEPKQNQPIVSEEPKLRQSLVLESNKEGPPLQQEKSQGSRRKRKNQRKKRTENVQTVKESQLEENTKKESNNA